MTAITPRTLTRAQLRAYLQVTHAEIDQRMAEGRLPKPLWGTEPDDPRARWDRAAVDRALDNEAGPTATLAAAERHLDHALGIR
jgi:hypothetical protein